MLKFELKIMGDSLAEVLAALNNGTALQSGVVSVSASGNDEDAGPINTNAPATDSEGLPWDERIHSANKGQNTNGTWRRRRGVDDATYASVVSSLRSAAPVAAAANAAPVATAPVAGLPMPGAALPMPGATPTQPAALPAAATAGLSPVPAAAALPASQPVAAGNPQTDYSAFMGVVASNMQIGRIDAAYLIQLAQRLGINAITDLMTRTDLIPTAHATLAAEGKLG